MNEKMKFLNNLYTISSICKEAVSPYVAVRFNPDHEVYKAHFPGNPITPGVLLMQIARIVLEDIVGKGLRLQEVVNIKFNKPVRPDDTATFTYTKIEKHDNLLRASIKIEAEGDCYAKMSLVYNIVSRPQSIQD